MTTHVFVPPRLAALVLRHRQLLLVAMLGLLHGVLLLGPQSELARALFITEVGLAMLWQPVLRAEQRVSLLTFALLTGLVSAIFLRFDWWMLAAWVMLAAGIVGGKIFLHETPAVKWGYFGALGYLVLTLLTTILPGIAPSPDFPAEAIDFINRSAVPALLVAMLALALRADAQNRSSPRTGRESLDAIDFIYSLFVFLLLAGLSLGALAFMPLFHLSYVRAMMAALMAFGLALLVLGWAWDPRAGFAGVGSLFSRQVLSMGLPLERWLLTLAAHAQAQAQTHATPRDFMAAAGADLTRHLDWVIGGDWQDGAEHGIFGKQEGQRSEFVFGDLHIGVVTQRPPAPTLLWHLGLLAQVLAQFYADQKRAVALRRLSYVEAIHNTGARLTHDVRNLLQSLDTLCDLAQVPNGQGQGQGQDAASNEALLSLVRRQLPAIRQRLAVTLEKLRDPRKEPATLRPASEWFDSHLRYAALGVACRLDPAASQLLVPTALFDSAAENLVQNALSKFGPRDDDDADAQPAPAPPPVRMELSVRNQCPMLSVTDAGPAIPPARAAQLMNEPVPSEDGLGIGLYQLARQAAVNGYQLTLAENRAGCVRFVLAGTP